MNLPMCTLNQSISCGLTDEKSLSLPRNLRPAGLVMQSAPADLRARFSNLIRLSLCLSCDSSSTTICLD